jgi:hypothetical protein
MSSEFVIRCAEMTEREVRGQHSGREQAMFPEAVLMCDDFLGLM